jgi:hypothetical protein
MDGRTFFDMQNVQPGELNGLVSIIDQAIGQVGYETGGRGVVYGLKVADTVPQALAQRVYPGLALFYDPAVQNTGANSNRRVKACRLSTTTSISLATDYLSASTAVNSGYERWVTLAIRSKVVDSDPRTAGDGSTVQFIQTESAELIVVSGTAALAGAATLPDVSTLGIRLADYLITYGMQYAPAAFLGAREDYVVSLMGGDAGGNNATGYSLLWQSNRNEWAMGVFRLYFCSGRTGYASTGLVLTWNARFDPVLNKWFSTDGVPCFALRLMTQGEGVVKDGLMLTQKLSAQTTGWNENLSGIWDKSITFSAGELASVHGAFSYTTIISVEGMSGHANVGQGAIPAMTAAIQFPCSISNPVITVLTTAFASADSMIHGGAANDTGFSSVSWYVTNTGAIVRVVPNGLDTYVRFNRLITIAASG